MCADPIPTVDNRDRAVFSGDGELFFRGVAAGAVENAPASWSFRRPE